MLINVGGRFVNPAHVVSMEMAGSNSFVVRLTGAENEFRMTGSAEKMNATADRINEAIRVSARK